MLRNYPKPSRKNYDDPDDSPVIPPIKTFERSDQKHRHVSMAALDPYSPHYYKKVGRPVI